MADFHEGLCNAMQIALKEAAEQIRALREENARLRAELKDRDPQLWEQSEQLQSWELRYASLVAAFPILPSHAAPQPHSNKE